MQQIGHVARRRTRRPSDADGRCVSSSRHGGPAARGLHGPLLFSAVAAHVFASVIHRPHRSAFGRCPSDLWLLRAIARSKLPALAISRLHIRFERFPRQTLTIHALVCSLPHIFYSTQAFLYNIGIYEAQRARSNDTGSKLVQNLWALMGTQGATTRLKLVAQGMVKRRAPPHARAPSCLALVRWFG